MMMIMTASTTITTISYCILCLLTFVYFLSFLHALGTGCLNKRTLLSKRCFVLVEVTGLLIYTVCPTCYRTRHFFNVMSTAIPGEVWWPTSAEQVQHLGLVEETGNQGDFIGRAYRRSSKNECWVR
jgi:hypothetical protein